MSGAVKSLKCNPTAEDKPASFLSLPSELRNRIYELVLWNREPINPWSGYIRQQELTLGLLRANKVVHTEASSMFYGHNNFDFAEANSEDISSFLENIGSNNARHIRHLCIDFPTFLQLEPGKVSLSEESSSILASIQSGFTSLNTLTTSLYSTNTMEIRLDSLCNKNIATEALQLVDTRFRAISSLEEIILEVYENGPSDYIRKTLESHGWKLDVWESEEEEWDREYSDFGGDDYHSYGDFSGDNDDEYDDEYDIDNDSDFWRRAAD